MRATEDQLMQMLLTHSLQLLLLHLPTLIGLCSHPRLPLCFHVYIYSQVHDILVLLLDQGKQRLQIDRAVEAIDAIR